MVCGLPVPREIALRSRSGLALHLGSLAPRRRGPDWNGRPTAEAWVSHREEIPRPHPSALTASREAMFSDPVRLCRLDARRPGAAAVFLPAISSAFSGKPDGAIRPPACAKRAQAPLTVATPFPSDNHVVRFRAWVQDCQIFWT
jgi:hypothetical protein